MLVDMLSSYIVFKRLLWLHQECGSMSCVQDAARMRIVPAKAPCKCIAAQSISQ